VGTFGRPARFRAERPEETVMPKAPPDPPPAKATDRGRKAGFDRRTGEVSGSGAGIGNPAAAEDYGDDVSTGSGGTGKPGGPSNSA
jgi:hypothetical protein